MRLLNTSSGIVHNATKMHDDRRGERYKLSCGMVVYVGIFKTRYTPTSLDVTCKNCLEGDE